MGSSSTSGVLGPGSGARSPQAAPNGGPATLDQWVMDFALSAAGSMANGTLNAAEGTVFTNAFMDAHGLNIRFDPSDFNAGRPVSENTHRQLVILGEYIATHWNELTPQQRSAFPDPTGLPRANPNPADDIDRQAAHNRQIQSDADAAALARQNASDAAAMARQVAGDAAALQRQQAADAAALERARLETQTQRDIATQTNETNERIAREDRLESARQFNLDIAERTRQFDLQLAEDRRQFNVEGLLGMFDRGIQLAQNPVDWLGYQYWLENLHVPVTALSLTSAAAMLGAIPPTGPSEAGAQVGGPAVIDGDMTVAQQLGIPNPGPMELGQAIQQNPGGSEFIATQGLTTADTVHNFGGSEQVIAAWERSMGAAVEKFKDMPGVGEYFQKAWESFGTGFGNIPDRLKQFMGQNWGGAAQGMAPSPPPPIPGAAPQQMAQEAGPPQQAGLTQQGVIPGLAGDTAVAPGQDSRISTTGGIQTSGIVNPQMPDIGNGFPTGIPPGVGGDFSGIPGGMPEYRIPGDWQERIANRPQFDMSNIPSALQSILQGLLNRGPQAPAQPTAEQQAQQMAQGQQGSTGGPYTGNEGMAGQTVTGKPLPSLTPISAATPPPAEPPTGRQPTFSGNAGVPGAEYTMDAAAATTPQQQPGAINPQLEAALQALAQAMGLPVEQIRALFPIELLSQTQAPGGVGNSPVIQNLMQQRQGSPFNTGPRTGGAFTNLPGFGGFETGIRGGQDVNAAHYLGALKPVQDMQQAVFAAQGLSVPGTLEQMLRSSPTSDLGVGSYGRRR